MLSYHYMLLNLTEWAFKYPICIHTVISAQDMQKNKNLLTLNVSHGPIVNNIRGC